MNWKMRSARSYSSKPYRVRRHRPKSAALPNSAATPPCNRRVRLRRTLPVAGALSAKSPATALQKEASTFTTVVEAARGLSSGPGYSCVRATSHSTLVVRPAARASWVHATTCAMWSRMYLQGDVSVLKRVCTWTLPMPTEPSLKKDPSRCCRPAMHGKRHSAQSRTQHHTQSHAVLRWWWEPARAVLAGCVTMHARQGHVNSPCSGDGDLVALAPAFVRR